MTVLALSHYEEVIDKEKKKERKDTSYLKERTTKRNGEKKPEEVSIGILT